MAESILRSALLSWTLLAIKQKGLLDYLKIDHMKNTTRQRGEEFIHHFPLTTSSSHATTPLHTSGLCTCGHSGVLWHLTLQNQ